MSRAALALWIALATNVALAETATVIDPTKELESPKAAASAPRPAQVDAGLKRERAKAQARKEAAAREAEARAARKAAAVQAAIERASVAREAAMREEAAKQAAAKQAAMKQAAARKVAAVQAAIARASVAKAAAARLAASREAAREAAARELAEREAAAREAAARALAAREAEEAAKQAAAREAAAKETAAREAAERALAAREAAERLIAARQAALRDNEIKRVSTREAPMLKEPAPNWAAFRDCARCPELVWLPQGDFVMGEASAAAGQRPTVAIRYRLAVGRYEVTFAEWDACFAAGGCRRRPHDAGWGRGWQPVINVSWVDAQQYAAWLSRSTGKRYRLLTEAEWEYAARAGTDVRYWWGDQAGHGDANCADCGSKWDGRQAAPVGRFAPNPFGLHDMHGNVSEWVEDCYHERCSGADPRVVRGGAWYGSARSMRSTSRTSAASDYSDNGIGFRVGRTE